MMIDVPGPLEMEVDSGFATLYYFVATCTWIDERWGTFWAFLSVSLPPSLLFTLCHTDPQYHFTRALQHCRVTVMLRSNNLLLCGRGSKKIVSEEWKALARRQAAPYRSVEGSSPHEPSSSPYSHSAPNNYGNGENKKSDALAVGGGQKQERYQGRSEYRQQGSSSQQHHQQNQTPFPSDDPRAVRHIFGVAQYDKDGNIVRDIDPVDLEQKIEHYHLSKYR